MSKAKFKPHQEVMVLGLLVNGKRVDAVGTFIQYCTHPEARGKVEVVVNTVSLYTTEDRLVDAVDYWSTKNKKDEN